MPTNLVALQKICFPELNHYMVVDEHLLLIVDSTILWCDIIFWADFLDRCIFHLEHDIYWMEYDIPLNNTAKFVNIVTIPHYSLIDIDLEDDCLGDVYIDSVATCILDVKHEQANNHNIAFD